MKKPQLCWDCKKAYGFCSWSHNFTPVKGWTATPVKIKVQGEKYVDTYHIEHCPEFEKE